MSKFLITPEEIEIIKELREDAKVCSCSIPEYLNQLINWAHEFVMSDYNGEFAEAMKSKIGQSRLSNWSIGEKGEIIKDDAKN